MNDKKEKKHSLFLIILKKIFNLRTLVPLVVMLSFNTYAWFLFSTKVETGINAKVRAWNILFETKDDRVVEHLEFTIDEIYPGMTTFTDYATVHNKGDGDASLVFEVESISILGTTYVVDDVNYTSDGLIEMLATDFPFRISLELTSNVISPNAEESFFIEVSWPYESGDDALDTTWGIKAYEYNSTNSGSPGVQLNIVLAVDQIN